MTLPQISEFTESRLQEIDALLALGGLQHSRRMRPSLRQKPDEKKSSTQKPPALALPSAKKTARSPVILRVPAWQQHSWLYHGFSTRLGGVSTIYRNGDLNLGFTSSGDRASVVKNRELFLRAIAATQGASKSGPHSLQIALLRQIHSGIVHRVPSQTQPGKIVDSETLLRGDGLLTVATGTLLGIQTADCFPILVADLRQRIVAAFHAGWRGTLARIAERGVGRMQAEFGSRPKDLTAAIGPGIGHCCFSVGEEVRMEFRSQFAYAEELFQEVFDLDPVKQKYPMLFLTARAPGHSNLGPSIHLDLAEANRRQLLDAGLRPDAIHLLNYCTACDTKHFFSHRAEHGFTGRMLSVVGIAA